MPDFTAILRHLSPEKFSEVLSASARKSRETYFHRHNIRAPKAGRIPRPGAKNEARTHALFDVLQNTADEELSEEVLRTWLLTKRPMLAAALDHLGIEHDNGLTESDDIKKFEKLKPKELKALAAKLEGLAPSEDIRLYLEFMGAEGVAEALS